METLTHDALEAAIVTLATQQDVVEHRMLTLIRDLDQRQRCRAHGLGSTAAWLGWRTGLGIVAAREKVRVAVALGTFQKIDAAFAKGELSYSKVRCLTRVATLATEDKLLFMASQGSAAQLDRLCRTLTRCTPTTATQGASERWLRVHPDIDGMMRIEVRFHADEAKLVLAAIDRARDASAEARPDRVDGLVRVADCFVANPEHGRSGGDRTQLVVSVAPDGLGEVTAQIDDAPLSAATLARVACDASLVAVNVDADGQALDVGRKTRTIPSAIRRALHHRDGGCRFPGCTHRRALDAHHIEHWADGGATSKDNLLLLCQAHHRLVHEGGFKVWRDGREVRFARPDGSVIVGVVAPRVLALELPRVAGRRERVSPRPDYNLAVGVLAPRVWQ